MRFGRGRQVGMSVHEPRQDPRLRQVYHVSIPRDLDIGTDRGDLPALDQNDLIRGSGTRIRVDQILFVVSFQLGDPLMEQFHGMLVDLVGCQIGHSPRSESFDAVQ